MTFSYGSFATYTSYLILFFVCPDTQSLVPEVETPSASRYHTIILDCSPIVFVDSMAVAAVEQVRMCDLLWTVMCVCVCVRACVRAYG